ncbi:MAG: hypothetical protein AB1750_09545 [Chloroflexota bacterium]
MAFRAWQIEKIKYCERVGHEVALEAEVVYPAEHLPDQPPHILARRCSNAAACNQFDQAACKWCGTNPDHDPM